MTLGLGLSWEGRPVFPLVLVLIERDGVEYNAPPNLLEVVPLKWPWDKLD